MCPTGSALSYVVRGLLRKDKRRAFEEQVCKPNSVPRLFRVGVAIIHLAHSSPNGSSDLPGGRSAPDDRHASGGQPCLTPPYLVLHCEEFAWPHVLPHVPVRSYFKPGGAAPFHPSPAADPCGGHARWLVCSLLHLSSPGEKQPRCGHSSPDALPLAGSLPCSVRTFLPHETP